MSGNQTQMAALWKQTALLTFATAKQLRDRNDYRSCVSRAYYAAYQAVTAVCIAHGDAVNFPPGRNNPSHEQLPDLIRTNSDLTMNTRRILRKILRELRHLREDADYRVGRTVNAQSVKTALLLTSTLFERLEIEDGNN